MIIDINKFPYPEIRKMQKAVINVINNNPNYRYYLCELPTGIGKSAIVAALCQSYKKAYIITSTKQLQDQYIDEFKHLSITSLKGKANYPCKINDKLNCENGPCVIDKNIQTECKQNNNCIYYNTRKKAENSNMFLTSYQYFLRALECSGHTKPRNVIVFDECHLLESQIVQWATMQLSISELTSKYQLLSDVEFTEFVNLSVPPNQNGYEPNKQWIKTIYDTILKKRNQKYQEIKNTFGFNCNPDELEEEQLETLYSTHKDYYDLDKFYKKLNVFMKEQNKDEWIIEPWKDGLELTPINVASLFHSYVKFYAIDKIIFMSATILDLPGFRKTFGLARENTLSIKTDSTFDPKKSPIFYRPVCKMNYENLDNNLDLIVDEVKKILDEHPDTKGVIHTGNYKIAKYLKNNIKSDRLLLKDDDSNNEKLVLKHINSKKPTVLVSPSLTTGADLKDDLSRFQIIVKAPFLSLADKRVREKYKYNKQWYAAEMFRTIIQAAGRSTRNEEDYSTTYILDQSFKWWINHYKNKGWFTKGFLNRIIW